MNRFIFVGIACNLAQRLAPSPSLCAWRIQRLDTFDSDERARGTSVAADPPPLGKRERSKLEKRARIMAAAHEVFVAKGFTAATIQEIATKAHVATGTVFLYTRSKEELLLQVFVGDVDQVLSAAEASLPGEGGTLARALHVYDALADYHREMGAPLTAVLVKELMHAPEDIRAVPVTTFIRSANLMARVIEAGRRSGELRAELDPAEAAEVLFSIFHWQISQWSLGRLSFEEFKNRVRSRFTLCLNGMAAGAAKAR